MQNFVSQLLMMVFMPGMEFFFYGTKSFYYGQVFLCHAESKYAKQKQFFYSVFVLCAFVRTIVSAVHVFDCE